MNNASNQETHQIVKIFESHIEVELDGITKAISLEDFKTSIDKGLNKQTKMDLIQLPPNIFAFARSESKLYFACYYPEQIREVQVIHQRSKGHTKPTKYTIPFPNTIVTHTCTLNSDRWSTSVRYYATDKTVGQLDSDADMIVSADNAKGIWVLPMPNIYSDGHACFGNNVMPNGFTKNFRSLDWYFKFLFASPFNEDLSLPTVPFNVFQWMQHLAALDKFPYKLFPGYKDDSRDIPSVNVQVHAEQTNVEEDEDEDEDENENENEYFTDDEADF